MLPKTQWVTPFIYTFVIDPTFHIVLSLKDFPNRLEVRPIGPRDPPVHFQRKQEYL